MRYLLISFLMLLFSTLSMAKTITVYIPFSPGGPTDSLWRSIEPNLNIILKDKNIKLITENLPGGGGAIAANRIASTKDRLVLGFFSPALAVTPAMNPEVAKYSNKSIRLVGYAGQTEMVLVSSKTSQEFYEKCSVGSMLYGSSGVGSTSHLLARMVIQELNCKESIHVPYKGQSAAYLDLYPGRIDFIVDFSISASSQISSGKVNKIFSVTEKFPLKLENWHVFISNNFLSDDYTVIVTAFKELKSNVQFVNDIERKFHLEGFAQHKDSTWLDTQFKMFADFANSNLPKGNINGNINEQ